MEPAVGTLSMVKPGVVELGKGSMQFTPPFTKMNSTCLQMMRIHFQQEHKTC